MAGTSRPGDDAEPRVPPQLAKVVEAIRDRYQPERVVLFGSRAWGVPTADSDVDLLVVKDTNEPLLKRCYEVLRLVQREKRGLPMDVLVYTPAELEARLAAGDPFLERVLREGVVLYGA